jgi:hypothetical protein
MCFDILAGASIPAAPVLDIAGDLATATRHGLDPVVLSDPYRGEGVIRTSA